MKRLQVRRLLSYRWLVLSLLAAWLLLNETFATSHVIVGAMLAVVASLVFARLGPPAGPARRARLGSVARLVATVLVDVVRSNIAVIGIVFGHRRSIRRAGFLPIPLDIRSRGALATLAVIVTSTPGTCWAGYDPDQHLLTLHVLDLHDEEASIRAFKARYEPELKEIFE